MAAWGTDDEPWPPEPRGSSGAGDDPAYQDGYESAMRELTLARTLGWEPTERQMTLALLRAVRMYGRVRGGKVIGGRHPEWLHGRADALRALLRQGIGTGGQ
ncbi:MAG TPA: hypothetical protein VIC85_04000 [Ktedonobacterales bacterium]|jgi:hypothetical protein